VVRRFFAKLRELDLSSTIAEFMKITLFHNTGAGSGRMGRVWLVRQFAGAGYDVFYVPTNEKGWEAAFRWPIDRAIIAGGDGTVGRLAPWLAARSIPFCILPLGTANNCAKTLGQMHTVESVVSKLHLARIKKLDIGVVISPAGYRIFLESVGVGLLAGFMSQMRARERSQKSRARLSPEERLSQALKHLRQQAKEFPEATCDILLDDQRLAGNLLLFEVANMGLIGPNLELVPSVDPADGRFEVAWVAAHQRKEWRNYLKQLRSGVHSTPPVNTSRCREVLLRDVDAPMHIDGEVFRTAETPVAIRTQSDTLSLLDFPA
jgi:diacylglycerol kinase family enzyme